MKNQTNEPPDRICATTAAKERLQKALRLLSGKWKSEILYHLVAGKQRFGQLRRAIPDVTQHMLTTQLRDLEKEGLVKRTVFPEVPPRVEYEMTPAARDLRPVFEELSRWAEARDSAPETPRKVAERRQRESSKPSQQEL